jgi:import inner membrane translocase subunit TIM16
MAPLGPLVRLLAQMVIPVVAVLARALPAAYAQALQNAKKAGVDAAPSAAASMLRKTVSRSEALQILNLTEKQAVASPEVILKVCTPLDSL